ncbi:MAG: hypothetical protein GY711_05250 [bacterium]|nr:hypothetical protein [bacterium]
MRMALATLAYAIVSMPGLTAVHAAASCPAPAASPLPQEVGGFYENKRFGFKFKAPRKWSNVALKTDEAWLAGKYMSDKTYFHTDKDTLWTMEHTPELMVIGFIDENMKKRQEELEEEDSDGVKKTTRIIYNPYKNYEDFLERTYTGGGWFIDDKKTAKVGKLEVTKYQIKVEKLSRSGPKRIITWIYHTDEIDYAMQTEILEDEHKKLSRIIERSYKSFKLIDREGKLPTSGKTHDFITITEMTEGTPKERRTKRMESQELLQRRAIEALPGDWGHERSGDVLLLHHDQEKWAKRLGAHTAVFMKWMEKTFGYIGKGEFVRAPIIRVCNDREEENSFGRGARSGSSWWFSAGGEILTHKDDEGFIGFEVGWVNRRLFGHWMQERDRDLAFAIPQWLSTGLYDYVAGARAKGNKLNFRVDDWDRDEARLAIAQGKAASPRELIKATRSEFRNSTGGFQGYWNRSAQASMLVRYLMSKEANRSKFSKGLLETYMVNLKAAVDEAKKKDNENFKANNNAETEEEEAEQAKARAERWRKKEKELMDDVFFRTFRDWSDKDWDAFEKGYFDWIS